MLTPDREAFIRKWAVHYQGTYKGPLVADDAVMLLEEIDRLRAEVDKLQARLHCELCNNTGILEDGRICPRCQVEAKLENFGLGGK